MRVFPEIIHENSLKAVVYLLSFPLPPALEINWRGVDLRRMTEVDVFISGCGR